jgi:glycosyltransferase involved in cell wall biosynthesis
MVAPFVSIVIPAYNEAARLPTTLAQLGQFLQDEPYSAEIVIVDDGSSDGTADILQELVTKRPEVRMIRFGYNAGQTAALDAGFKWARGQVVVTLDADQQNDPGDIPHILETLKDYDVVCGIRQCRQDTRWRRLSSKIANSIRRSVLHDDIIDIGCSLRAYRRHCLTSVKLYHGMHRFLPVLLRLEGFRIGQLPVSHHPRRYGLSKYNARNRAWRALMDLLAVRWMQSRQLRYEIIKPAQGASG